MNDSVFKFSLDIHQTRVQTFFNVMRGDTKRRLEVILTEKGEPYEITDDCYAVFSAKKADGHVIFNDCTIKDSTIFYTLTPQTVAAVGPLKCEIKLYGAGDALITSPRFTIAVESTLNEDDNIQIESADEVTALTALISEATAVVNEVETKLENGEFVGPPGPKGEDGDVRFEEFTEEQKESLRGPQGFKGDKGEPGEKGETGEQGPKGDKGDKGDTGATGPEGPQGPKGEDGKGLTILGYYSSVSALINAVPNPEVGDIYGIGSTPPYNLYAWDGELWIDNGKLQGAKGDKGDKGDTGEVDYGRLDAYLPLSGGTMTGELIFNGGDKSEGSKIVLETGKGQITNSGTQTLFGFTATSTIAVGHSSYILAMRGNGARPKYNSNDLAFKSDIDSAIEAAIGATIGGSY